MPRKPKLKTEILIVIEDKREVTLYLHPPSGNRKSWYVYWPGLKNPKSTGARTLEEAKREATKMLRSGKKRKRKSDGILTDEEFEEIQRRHFAKKTSPDAKQRAKRSLDSCIEAISAFREISGLSPITTATADDCERFQHAALERPKDWRRPHPNKDRKKKAQKEEEVATLRPNTVLKWSVALRAAWGRANRNSGKKCVRGVVPPERLLTENPWNGFSWIEGSKAEIRQFKGEELLSILDYFQQKWPCMTIAPLMAKVFLWSWGRKSEVAGLRWDMLRQVGDEFHFEVVGKWAVDKWFRVPASLHRELSLVRVDSPFVFGGYPEQLRKHHRQSSRPWIAEKVAEKFDPDNLGDWFYERVKDWSASAADGSAYLHMFRKTTLQYARAGEDANRLVASDARLGERVMMTSYVKETDEEMRQKSNRTFKRIANSLGPEVAERYGHVPPRSDGLIEKLNAAVAAQNWPLVATISAELERRNGGQEAV